MVLTAVYLHKRKAEEVKAGLGVCTGVLFPPVCVCVCVCDVGYCWVLILTVRGQWARVLLKPYLTERRIGPNPGQSLPHTGAKAAAFRIMCVWGAGVESVF